MTITKQALEKLNQLGPEAAAAATGKSVQAVNHWIRTESIPSPHLDAIFDAVIPEPESEELEPTQPVEDVNIDTEEPNDTEARLFELHDRLTEVEALVATIIDRNVVTAPQADQIRPGGGYKGMTRAQNTTAAQNGNDYVAGNRTGRAPTREQAHWSSMGQRGRVAGPATPRQRPANAPGNKSWNKSKPTVK